MIDIWCIYAVNLREKMSQITHFCGVKFLAWKSSSVKFWTNIMSAGVVTEKGYFLFWYERHATDINHRLRE